MRRDILASCIKEVNVQFFGTYIGIIFNKHGACECSVNSVYMGIF